MRTHLENLFPGNRVQINFCQKGNDYYLVLCCQMSGFMQVYRCRNKSTEEALLKLKEWSSNFGFPMTLVTYSGISFRNRFEEEYLKLGVKVERSSACNSSSQSAVERSIANLKNLLKRTSHMNQLQLSECVFALNSRIQPDGCGSPIAKLNSNFKSTTTST